METETGRVEAFSDGVFAVIITILVLELKVPEETGSDFWHGVREQWPHYAAYVVSFLIIGVMWVNHHTIFSHIKRVDRPLLFLNLLVLMVVSVVPYTTNVLAEHLMEEGGSANAAAVLYSLLTVAYALAFLAFWWYVTRVGHLFHDHVDKNGARATRVRFGLGAIAYPCTVALAFFSAPLTLVAHFLIALYYAANQIPIPLVVEEERLETVSDLRK